MDRQFLFTAEIDKMTAVMRRTMLIDKSRRENDAEHSWHIAVMAMLFREYAAEPVDIGRVVQMCVVHDLVEILGILIRRTEKRRPPTSFSENFRRIREG